MGLRWRRRGLSVLSLLVVLLGLVGLCGFTGVAGASSPSGSGGAFRVPSMGNDCTPATVPAVRVDGALDSAFADQLGPGWVGGDATYSTQLPDGREAFVFSDTLIGTAQPDGTATFAGFAHNSELYGWLPGLRSNYGGTFTAPQPLIPDSAAGGDQWQVAATFVEHGRQLVFVNEFAPTSTDFEQFTGRSGLAVLILRRHGAPSFSSIVALPSDPTTQWGNALLQAGGYSYVYGDVTGSGQFSGMKLARVPRGAALQTAAWEYWTGASWVSGESNAVTIATGNDLTGVVPQGDHVGFEAVSIPGSVFTDTALDLSYACSPEGPWSAPASVYAIPQVEGLVDQIAYIPTFHPELSRRWDTVISYNVNTIAGYVPLETQIHGYQPHFVLVSSTPWVRNPDPPPAETPETPLPLLLPLLAATVIGCVYVLRRRRAHRAMAPREGSA
jgi:hypothetical protein